MDAVTSRARASSTYHHPGLRAPRRAAVSRGAPGREGISASVRATVTAATTPPTAACVSSKRAESPRLGAFSPLLGTPRLVEGDTMLTGDHTSIRAVLA